MNKLISIIAHFIAALCCILCATGALAALDRPDNVVVAALLVCTAILIWDSVPNDDTKEE